MLVLGACLLQKLYTQAQPRTVAMLITAVVILGTCTMAVVYVRSGEILIHLVTFSIMVHLIWPRTLFLIYRSYAGESACEAIRRSRVLQFWRAAAVLVGAFVVWNIDLERCLELRALREKLGLPWAWILELHGWWHVLTAVGAAEYVYLVRDLCAGYRR